MKVGTKINFLFIAFLLLFCNSFIIVFCTFESLENALLHIEKNRLH